jgi:hypothetical protein
MPSSTCWVNGAATLAMSPLGRTMAVMPVLVARNMKRPVSSARLGQLQMLAHGHAFAEPGQIADIGQNACLGSRADQLFAKAVLIADIEGNLVACQRQWMISPPREKPDSGMFMYW